MHLSNESLIVIILVGVIAGWLAGQIMQGSGFGLVGDLIIGIVGAFIGDWLLPIASSFRCRDRCSDHKRHHRSDCAAAHPRSRWPSRRLGTSPSALVKLPLLNICDARSSVKAGMRRMMVGEEGLEPSKA